MDEAEDPDLNLSVPLRPIFEELCCPICFSVIKQCTITPCGHNFCEPCILECINRKHQCPCCNNATTRDQLFRNRHIDKLIGIVNEQKEIASKAYFEKLIKTKPPAPSLTSSGRIIDDGSSLATDGAGGAAELSPIEVLFHKHMKRSLMAYEEYYRELSTKYEASRSTTLKEYADKMRERTEKYERRVRKHEKSKAAEPEALASKLAEIRKSHESKSAKLRAQYDEILSSMERSFNDSVALLLEGYDKYMLDFAPTPAYLPVTVSLTIPSRNVRFDRVQLSTTDNVGDVKRILLRLLQESQNPMASEFTAANVFAIRKPYLSPEAAEAQEVLISDENRPVVQYKLEQGSELALKGEVQLESDKPKMCFTATYQKGDKVDYFTCADCKINWICKTCATSCHEGHRISVYLLNNTPSWACCYCVKHRKCRIINNRNNGSSTSTSTSMSMSMTS